MKIVPAGVGYRRPWRAGSWDRFAVPRPFTRARCLTAEPVAVHTARPFRPLRLSQAGHLKAGHGAEERPEPPTERATPA